MRPCCSVSSVPSRSLSSTSYHFLSGLMILRLSMIMLLFLLLLSLRVFFLISFPSSFYKLFLVSFGLPLSWLLCAGVNRASDVINTGETRNCLTPWLCLFLWHQVNPKQARPGRPSQMKTHSCFRVQRCALISLLSSLIFLSSPARPPSHPPFLCAPRVLFMHAGVHKIPLRVCRINWQSSLVSHRQPSAKQGIWVLRSRGIQHRCPYWLLPCPVVPSHPLFLRSCLSFAGFLSGSV